MDTPVTTAVKTKDHRRVKRKAAKKHTAVICRKGSLGLGPNVAVRIEDISGDGIRLLIKVAVQRGDELEITLQPAGFGQPVVRHGTVVWCCGPDENQYHVGVKFDKTLQYNELFVMTG